MKVYGFKTSIFGAILLEYQELGLVRPGHWGSLASPLLEDGSIKGARAVLINITGGMDLGMYEINEAISVIKNEVDTTANIKFGTVINPVMSEEIMVMVIATDFDDEGIRERVKRPAAILSSSLRSMTRAKASRTRKNLKTRGNRRPFLQRVQPLQRR